jgi:hypothetical protein
MRQEETRGATATAATTTGCANRVYFSESRGD